MGTQADKFADQVAGIAALNEPVRRDLYLYVSSQPGAVSRDDASAACGISRALAAFHLDKLVDEGLLEATYRRLSGRAGPGAGRPSKLYCRSSRQISVNLPPRSYELAAKLFVAALDGPQGAPERVKLGEIARRFGETAGMEAGALAGTIAKPGNPLDAISAVLGAYGYEPFRGDCGEVRLRNCPFHALASDHRELVCNMNLQLMNGVVDGIGACGVRATLDPRPNECCVAFQGPNPDSDAH